METLEAVTERLEDCFRSIAQERMAGIPILNNALDVEAVGMRERQNDWLCILVTPWFMNVMLLPKTGGEDARPSEAIRVGTKKNYPFPGGRFEFIRGNEDAIGPYWACSLFSPVLEFADHETAVAAAEAAMEAIFAEAEEATEQEHEMAMIWAGKLPEAAADEDATAETIATAPQTVSQENEESAKLSRRAFLRGKTKEAQA